MTTTYPGLLSLDELLAMAQEHSIQITFVPSQWCGRRMYCRLQRLDTKGKPIGMIRELDVSNALLAFRHDISRAIGAIENDAVAARWLGIERAIFDKWDEELNAPAVEPSAECGS